MFNLRFQKIFIPLSFLIFLLCHSFVVAGLNVVPKVIFVNSPGRFSTITVTNPGDKPIEVWIDAKFGYVISDDSGKPIVKYDSTVGIPESATDWLRFYPQRFFLEGGETQLVRVAINAPLTARDGEYWARIMLSNKNRNIPTGGQEGRAGRSGFSFAQTIGIPFHYRRGAVITGLDVRNLDVTTSPQDIKVSFDMVRTGNAAYWGTVAFRLLDKDGVVKFTDTKRIAVYKTYSANVSLNRTGISAGTYTLDVNFATGARGDVRQTDLVQSQSLRITRQLVLE